MTRGARSSVLAVALSALATVGLTGQVNQPKPDLVVADSLVDGNDLVLVVQNQGPGTAKQGIVVDADVGVRDLNKQNEVRSSHKVTVPVEPFALTELRIPLNTFELTPRADGRPPALFVSARLDVGNELAEEREKNNDHFHQFGDPVGPPRGNFRGSRDLPDLVVTNVTATKSHFYVHYRNTGRGVTGADFLIQTRHVGRTNDGNHYYRFKQPAPGAEAKTGGFGHGLAVGTETFVVVTIDFDDRVRESDEKNNTFKKMLVIPND